MTGTFEKHARILIVEDDPNSSSVYAQFLCDEGYSVDVSSSVEEVRGRLERQRYDIILLDIRLPGGSGLEVLKYAGGSYEKTEVIVITGYASVENAIEALNMGAFAYLRKPVNIEELKIFISRALELKRLTKENLNLLERFKELSLKDPHTELYNYRYLGERLKKELSRARRYGLPLSVVKVDIDNFKSVNDVYGHVFGDLLLKEFSDIFSDLVRTTDVVIRYGGEEFVVLLTDTDKDGAVMMARRMLDALNRYTFDPEGKRVRLTVSVSVWSLRTEDYSSTVSGVMDAVGKAMLKAKESGGSRLEVYDEEGFGRSSRKDMLEVSSIRDFQDKISQMEERANRSVIESIYALAKTIDAKHSSIGEHGEDMVGIVEKMGLELNLSKDTIEKMKHAALLHDLGKIGVPDSILGKKGPLTPSEYELVRKHPQMGAEIVRSIHTLEGVSQMILHHHERYNGLGYPAGLKGKKIPLPAGIIAVVDVYEALTAERPYNQTYSRQEALEIIEEASGTEFDPDIVRVFIKVMREDTENKNKGEEPNE